MRVRFLQVASVQGQGYRRGEQAELPDDIALAYIQVGQAEQIEQAEPTPAVEPLKPVTEPLEPTPEPAPTVPKRPTKSRRRK